MSSDLLQVLEYIEREKGISRDTIIAAVESSLITASKKSLGTSHDLSVTIDPKTADIKPLGAAATAKTAPPTFSATTIHVSFFSGVISPMSTSRPRITPPMLVSHFRLSH